MNHVNLLDGSALFCACETIAEKNNVEKININYTNLSKVLRDFRKENNWPDATDSSIMLAINLESDRQIRFCEMLKTSGFIPHPVEFRNAVISNPAGKAIPPQFKKVMCGFTTSLAYSMGLLSRQANSSLIIASHAFELYEPLYDFVNRGGKACLAFFGSMLDYRWHNTDLFIADNSPLQFLDLEEFSKGLVGIDLLDAGDNSDFFNCF